MIILISISFGGRSLLKILMWIKFCGNFRHSFPFVQHILHHFSLHFIQFQFSVVENSSFCDLFWLDVLQRSSKILWTRLVDFGHLRAKNRYFRRNSSRGNCSGLDVPVPTRISRICSWNASSIQHKAPDLKKWTQLQEETFN